MQTKTPVTEMDLAEWAKESMNKHAWLSIEYSNDEALALVERMRHEGILHLSAQDRAEVPLTALRDWLIGSYAQHIAWQPPPHPRGQSEE